MGSTHYDENMFRKDIENWDRQDIEEIFEDSVEASERSNTQINNITAKDISLLVTALEQLEKFIGSIAYDIRPFSIYILFKDDITDILVEYDKKLKEYKENGYQIIS